MQLSSELQQTRAKQILHIQVLLLSVLLLLTGIIAEPQTEHKLVIVAGFRLCTTGLPGDIRPRFAPCSFEKLQYGIM